MRAISYKEMMSIKNKIRNLIPPPTYELAFNEQGDEYTFMFSDGRKVVVKSNDTIAWQEVKDILHLAPWETISFVYDDLGEDWEDEDIPE